MSPDPFRAWHWAETMPPIRNEAGRVDAVAHRTLNRLAFHANNTSLQAWPGVDSMAAAFGYERREIRRALGVLEKLGLIVDCGETDRGCTIWRLEADGSDAPERLRMAEEQRVADLARSNAARQAKHRQSRNSGKGVTSNSDSPVTPPAPADPLGSNSESPVTPAEPVTAGDPLRNGESPVTSQRQPRYVTAGDPLRNAAKAPRTTNRELPRFELPSGNSPAELPTPTAVGDPDPAPADRGGVVTPEELGRKLARYRKPAASKEPPAAEPAPTARQARSRALDRNYTPEFDTAWAAYGRKGSKPASFRRWKEALERTDLETIQGAIPHYVANTKGPKDREGRGADWKPGRKDFEEWLNKDGWESESAQPTKPRPQKYQGRAGADARPREDYENETKRYPVPRLMRKSPFVLNRDGCYAWYYHWNRAEQADWSLEQLVEYGNTPEDAEVLHEAFRAGPRPSWRDLLATVNIETDY